jgi:hypothetical protein
MVRLILTTANFVIDQTWDIFPMASGYDLAAS